MAGELDGKVAVITGAASGIGRATAMLFASEGAKLIVADKADGVRETADMVKDAGAHAAPVQMDAGDEGDVKSLIQTAIDTYGALDIAYANAGIIGSLSGIFDDEPENWEQVLRVNLIGPWLMIKHAGKYLADQGRGGSIICTASVAGLRSGAGGVAYSASKAGVINLVQVAAQQLSTANVRVNAICPGLVETGMTGFLYEAVRKKGKEDRIGQLNPLRRGGEPSEIAEAALFLASGRSSYVNGHALVVDGGLSSSHPVSRQPFGQMAI